MSRFLKRFRLLWRRKQLDRDLEDELRFHLEMKAADTGDVMEARRRIGNLSSQKEVCRDLWTFVRLETWWQDIRYAIRTLVNNPGFTAAAVIALALGIGANTGVFSILNGVTNWNMGLEDRDRIVLITATDASQRDDFGASYPDFRDFRASAKSLSGLAAYDLISVNLSDRSSFPERYNCVQISANGFAVVGHRPAVGRDFVAADEAPGAAPVLMLGHHVWQQRYGSDPGIVGKTVRVNEATATIIGVMPPGRRFPEDTDLWMALRPDAEREKRENRSLALFGHLAPGATLGTARAEFQTLAQRLAVQYPVADKGLTAKVRPIYEITGAYGTQAGAAILFAAVGFVLLIACADVANLLLARATGRAREISIRVAIGAGRFRIVRQLLIESVLLSLAGGVLGWFVATGGLRWFAAATADTARPPWIVLSLNLGAFAYLAAISVVTGILFGLSPALRLAKLDVFGALRDGGHTASSGPRGRSLAGMLVIGEMALCVVLLVAAGLMIRSMEKTYNTPIGVNPAGVLTMHVYLPELKYAGADEEIAFHKSLQARLTQLPGVVSASVATTLPAGGSMSYDYQLEGAPPAAAGKSPRVGAMVVGRDYFRVMQAAPRMGRDFADTDETGIPVAVINQSFAARTWPNQNPLGKRLRVLKGRTPQAWMTIVGVIPDILQNRNNPAVRGPLLYVPYVEAPQRAVYIVARTRIPPEDLARAFRREVQAVDENLPVYDVRTLDTHIALSRLTVRLFGGTLIVFAFIALVLASVGSYAVIADSVNRRKHEIGIRLALGGTQGTILRLVFRQGLRQVAIGLAIGLPLALAVTRTLRSFLVYVTPSDPATFAGVTLVVLMAGVLGCAVPAYRAIRVDPIETLRCE